MLQDSAGYVDILLEPRAIARGQNSWSLEHVYSREQQIYHFFKYDGFYSTSSIEQCPRNQLIKGVALTFC